MSKVRQHRGAARRLWLKVHLYLGLFAGALLALLGVTGSILVFDSQLDRLLNPQFAVAATDAAAPVSTGDVLGAVERRFGLRPYYLEAPTEGGPYVAFIDAPGRTAEVRAVVVDPANGRILGNRRWGGYFTSFIRELHANLFLGVAGTYIVGAVSVLALVSILTGLYLWWPRARAFRRALTFHWRWHATTLNFEIHRICGFYLAAVLFVLALTGTYLALPEPFTAAVGAVATVAPRSAEVASALPPQSVQRLSLTEIEQVVEQYAPGAAITGYQLPEARAGAYAVYYRDPAEPYSRYGRSAVWIDQYSGDVLESRQYLQLGAADRFLSSQILLHNGRILGLTGRWLVFVAGLAIPVMYGTGFYLWWRRRGTSRRKKTRASNAATA